jgi:hypothetical protein
MARAWQLAMLGQPIVTVDTPMYRSEGQPWLDFKIVDFLGYELRAWPVTALYALAPNDRVRVLAQFVIATVCWVYCIRQFGMLTPNRLATRLASLAVAVLALTVGVSGFDALLMSESLTMSLVALYVGALLSLAGGRGRLPTVVVALVAAALLALLRPVLVPLPAGIVLVAYLMWMRNGAERRARARASVVAVAAVAVAAMAYGWTYNVNIDKTWGHWVGSPGLNGRTLHQYYVAAYGTPFGPRIVEAMVDGGGPTCLRAELEASAATPSRDHLAEERKSCPQGQRWLSDHFVPTLVTHFATHPADARRYFRDALRDQSVLRADGQPSMPTVVPDPLTALYFSETPGLGDPLVLWSLVAVALVVFRRRQGAGADDDGAPTPSLLAGRSAIQLCIGFTALVAYAGLVGTALLSAIDASRVALPVTVLIRLVLIAVVVPAAVAITVRGKTGPITPRVPDTRPPRSTAPDSHPGISNGNDVPRRVPAGSPGPVDALREHGSGGNALD